MADDVRLLIGFPCCAERCYVCGRMFGSRSLPIHQKQCLKKRKLEQSRLPKHLRTPLKKPAPQGAQNDDDAAFAAWKESLAPCPHCGRTFQPDRLVVHLRSCKVMVLPATRCGALTLECTAARSETNRPQALGTQEA